MAERLAVIAGADHPATRDSFAILPLMHNIESRHRHISDVWRSVEWFSSNDYGEDQVREFLEKYEKTFYP